MKHLKRYLTAVVAIPLAILLVWAAPAPLFLGVTMVFAYIAYSEFVVMHKSRNALVFLPAAALLMFAIYAYATAWHLFLLHIAAAFIIIPLLALLGSDPIPDKHDRLLVHLAGFLYLVIPFSLFSALREYPDPTDGKKWFLFALIMPWVCDSAAFFVGSAMGKHRLAPQISPNKSWEGAIAGLIASVAAGAAFSYIAFDGNYLVFSLVTAALASTAGQAGDLVESLFKRGAGVKDSGTLFPGHGGILDRLDSVLFSVTVTYIALKYMEYHVL